MQEDGVAAGEVADSAEHGVEVEAIRIAIEVAVGADSHAGGLEDLRVIGPRGFTDPEAGVGEEAVQEIGGQTQSARAAWRLHSDGGLAIRPVLTEQQLTHSVSVFRGAVYGQVGLRSLGREDAVLCLGHRFEHGGLTPGVSVLAHSEIDLAWIDVFAKRRIQTQDGIGRRVFECLEHLQSVRGRRRV